MFLEDGAKLIFRTFQKAVVGATHIQAEEAR